MHFELRETPAFSKFVHQWRLPKYRSAICTWQPYKCPVEPCILPRTYILRRDLFANRSGVEVETRFFRSIYVFRLSPPLSACLRSSPSLSLPFCKFCLQPIPCFSKRFTFGMCVTTVKSNTSIFHSLLLFGTSVTWAVECIRWCVSHSLQIYRFPRSFEERKDCSHALLPMSAAFLTCKGRSRKNGKMCFPQAIIHWFCRFCFFSEGDSFSRIHMISKKSLVFVAPSFLLCERWMSSQSRSKIYSMCERERVRVWRDLLLKNSSVVKILERPTPRRRSI